MFPETIDCGSLPGNVRREARREGNALSSTETIENSSESTHAPDHAPAREGAEAGQDAAHDHEHRHGPVLNPECTRELVIDVPADEVSAAYRRVTAQYRRYARIPGFRAGKVPESIVRRRYAGEIRREVIDALLPARFNQGVQELGVRPVGQPQVTELTVDDGAPMHVKAVFEYIPEFSIDGYRDVTVPKPSVEVTEEEFQQELEQLRDSRSTMEPVEEDRALADGDFAQISYKGRIEGDPEAEPIAGEDALVEIGGKSTVEAFTTALRGAKAGQELKAEVVYPADYAEPRLAGKTVVYELSVKGIKKRNLPELNDEFAKEIGGYESAAELEGAIRERLARRKRRAVENDTREKLLAAIAERFSFPVPESLVQEQIDNRLERGLRALAAQGMAPEAMRRLDFSRLRAAQRDAAVSDVRTQMLLDRIAREENITVTDEELDNELQMISIQGREPLGALKERLTQDGGLGRIREQIRREKTASALYERLSG